MPDISIISDSQAEAGVIATLIAHPNFMLNVPYMKPGYFYNVENGCIYWAISQLFEEGIEKIDSFNISSILNSNKAVKKKMTEFNITNFQEFVDLSQYAARDTIEEYKMLVNIVITMAFKRELNKFSLEIQRACFNDEHTLDSLSTLVNEGISNITSKFIVGSDSTKLGDKIRDIWDSIVEKRNADGTYGLPSKINLFNEYFTFAKGELILLTARMKRGKSAYFMNECIHKAIHNNIPTLYIDTEMSTESFTKRVICNLTGIEIKRIETGNYSEEEAAKVEKALQMIEKAPLVHEYLPNFNATQIEALCQNWKYKMGLEFVIYDYMKCDETKTASEVSSIMGNMCNHLKNTIAGKLDLAVLAGAQLNRENEVALSDKIEMFCSTAIRWREKSVAELETDGLDGGNYCARIVLNRNGRQHAEDEYVSIRFDGDHMRINQAKRQGHKTTPFG